MAEPQLDEVIMFVRKFTGVRKTRHIAAETRLDSDLGVTGDDGDDLLRAAIQRFGVDLASTDNGIAQTLKLGPNEYFFGSEGLDLFGIFAFIARLAGRSPPIVRDLTVGELHEAICKAPPLKANGAA